MRRSAWISLLAFALVLVVAAPSLAWRGHRAFHHGHVFIGVGPAFWWDPWWYYPPYYYSPPPTVVVQEPPVYVQREPVPSPDAPADSYWYYCPSAKGYYPYVKTCPETWVKVSPRPQ